MSYTGLGDNPLPVTALAAGLASLRALEKQLRSLRTACSGQPGAQGCGILHELVAAAHGEACACHTA